MNISKIDFFMLLVINTDFKNFNSQEVVTRYCWFLQAWRVAKRGQSDRSRQALPNEYLIARIGCDSAENGLREVGLATYPWPLPLNDQALVTILPIAVPNALLVPIDGPRFGRVAALGPILRLIFGPPVVPIVTVADLAPVITCA